MYYTRAATWDLFGSCEGCSRRRGPEAHASYGHRAVTVANG